MKEETLFHEALALPPAERQGFLEKACGGDHGLRRRLEELLDAHEQRDSFLCKPPVPPHIHPRPPGAAGDSGKALDSCGSPAGAAISESAGSRIGPYKLLQEIGEGGMGVVFMAEQTEPVQRKVAIKIIKPGMDSRQVIARFEAERQALALMDHPNIAKVLDAGATDSGLPYFVMELVRGKPITEYCDEHHLTPSQRLALFVPVCQAVQHAHQKGVIHRDLKPSNVMIALYDGRPVPKVIDFGVAKAAGPKLTEKTLFTAFGAVIGTLHYMSPEQAELNQLDVDTRSDIYALGVLLYELLTGTTPLEPGRLKQAALLEALRIIREEEPPRPSTRLSTTKELPAIAGNRGVDPSKLSSQVRGELDWIVMKCLEKDRGRRYETANGLALDIERFLRQEPVTAGPPGTAYRVRKFVQRNRVAVIFAGLMMLVLVGGAGAALAGYVAAESARRDEARQRLAAEENARRANEARDAEAAERKAAEQAREAESAAREIAEDRRKHLETANQTFIGLLREVNPQLEEKGGPPLREQLGTRLAAAAKSLDDAALGGPLAAARIRADFGEALRMLGYSAPAAELLEEALRTYEAEGGVDPRDLIAVRNNLGMCSGDRGRWKEAVERLEKAHAEAVKTLGPEDPDTLLTANNLGKAYIHSLNPQRAIAILTELHEILKRIDGPGGLRTTRVVSDLGLAHSQAREFNKALAFLQEALDQHKRLRGEDHFETIESMNNLGMACRDAGKFDRAIELHEAASRAARSKFGDNHPCSIISLNNLAAAHWANQAFAKAVPMLEEALQRATARLGETHPWTLRIAMNLGMSLRDSGQREKGLAILKPALEKARSLADISAETFIELLAAVAETYLDAGDLANGLPLLEELVKVLNESRGREHDHTRNAAADLIQIYQNQGRFPDALKLAREIFGSDAPETLVVMSGTAFWHARQQGRLDLAEKLLTECVAGMRKLGTEYRLPLGAVLHQLGTIQLERGKWRDAESALRESLKIYDQLEPNVEIRDSILGGLGACLVFQEKYSEAEPFLRECLKLREKTMPNHWLRFNTMSMLGASLLGQGNRKDAEPLLLDGYQGMKQREKQIPPQARVRLVEGAGHLVKLYDVQKNAAEAEKWRIELEEQMKAIDPPKP